MSNHASHENINKAFREYCKVAGFRIAVRFDDTGAYSLDWRNKNKGYRIVRIDEPLQYKAVFDNHYYPAGQFYNMLRFATETIRQSQS